MDGLLLGHPEAVPLPKTYLRCHQAGVAPAIHIPAGEGQLQAQRFVGQTAPEVGDDQPWAPCCKDNGEEVERGPRLSTHPQLFFPPRKRAWGETAAEHALTSLVSAGNRNLPGSHVNWLQNATHPSQTPPGCCLISDLGERLPAGPGGPPLPATARSSRPPHEGPGTPQKGTAAMCTGS